MRSGSSCSQLLFTEISFARDVIRVALNSMIYVNHLDHTDCSAIPLPNFGIFHDKVNLAKG